MTDREAGPPTDVDVAPTGATKREGHPTRPEKPEKYLARGALVGRYVIVDKLGEGGMGVVYSAFDPELDRKVAVKLLQAAPSGGTSGGEQAWMLREAQALARLQHPNVVAVHDVGVLPGDQVFVAMELVDGVTMRTWLKAKARSWREVVPVMRAAGAGLAAAHAAGLVHRDFKPENILVDKDGRVRVMDFGLARLRREDDPSGPAPPSPLDSSRSPLSVELTQAGHVVGTPAYIAPELYEGAAADARSDQFAFGVALFEGLFHTRPFDRKELARNRSAPPVPKLPAKSDVPAQLQRIALRTLAVDPAQRYASIDELVAELARDPLARRRRVLIAVAAAAVVLAFGGGAYALAHRRGELCSGAEQRLAGVWDSPAKDAARRAFDATKQPYAAQSFAGVERALDKYTREWSAAVTESCAATRVRGEQTEEVMSLREACLDQRLLDLRALTKLLATADAGLVEKGDKAVFALESLAGCANVAALRSPGLPPFELRPQILAIEVKLSEARAHLIAGHVLPALTLSQEAATSASELHWEPLAAEATFLHGAGLLAVGNQADATAEFERTVWAALRGHGDNFASRVSFSVAANLTVGLGKVQEADTWVELGDALAARLPRDLELDTIRYQVSGLVATEHGDLNKGVALYEKAFAALTEACGGKDCAALVGLENDYATTLSRAGAYGKAEPHYEHALALRIASVGEDHPDVPLFLSNLGICYRHTGQLVKAQMALARALATREKLFGKRHPFLVPTLDNYGELLLAEHDYAGALAMFERAKQIAVVIPGPTHPQYHQLLTDYADALVAAGRTGDARAMFDEAFALERQNDSNVLPKTETSRANLAIALGDWPEAQTQALAAIGAFEFAGGKDNPELWRPLAALASAKTALGDTAAARALLVRALAIADKAHVPDFDLAATKDQLARLPP
jgi:tetratricopeptide (TPR) repeat protein